MNNRPVERIGNIFLSTLGHRVLRPLAFFILTLTVAVNAVRAQAQEPGIFITGQLVDASGKGVAGAQVRLDGPTVHARAVTNGSGSFTFLVPPITITALLRVTRTGFEALRKTLTLDGHENVSLGRLAVQAQQLRVIGSTISHERLPFNSTPASTKVFPREAYRDEGQPGIEAVLDQTAGLQTVRTSSLRGTPEYPIVRNGSPEMTATSIDGIRVESARTALFNVALLPTYVLQDVEVTRGAGSAAIAPHQLFGSVNFRTADPAPVTRATFETETDSAHGSFGDAGGTIGGEDSAFSAAMMFSADGSSNADFNLTAPAFRIPYSRRAGFVKARYAPSGDASITATALKTHLNAPGFGSAADDFTLASLDFSGRLSKSDDLELRMYGYGLHHRETFLSTDDGMEGASATWSHAIAANRYEASAEIRHATATSSGFAPGSDQRELSLRTSAEVHPNERATITLSNALIGFHQDAVRRFAPTSSFKGTSDVVHAGAAYRLKPGLSLRASAGTGVDPSDLQSLASFGSAFRLPSSIAYDAGAEWRLHGDTTTLSADAYRTIVRAPFRSTTVDGAEITIQQFKRVGLGYIAQVSLTGPAPFFYRIPYSRSYEEISYKWPRGSRLSLGALTYGHGNAAARGDAFTVVNSNLELSLGRFEKLQVSVENLTNARGGFAVFAAPGGVGYVTPRTFRFMFRQSAGGGLVER